MLLPVQITTRDIAISQALETHIRERTNKLNRFYDRISSCRIVIEFTQKHKHQGKLYNIRIDITVPGKELVVTRKQDEDVYVAIRDAFNAIVRQLEEHSRKRQGRVKTHSELMHGHVVRLFKDEGYGFIQGLNGDEYYFSITNVGYPKFNTLMVGDPVEFVAIAFNDGWQANHVLKLRHNNITAA